MKRSYRVIILAAIMLVAGCSQKDDIITLEHSIMMRAMVSDVQVETKTESAYVGTTPSEDNPLNADLWFTLTSGDYSVSEPVDENTYLPCHTYATFKSGDITPISYRNDNTKVLKYPTSGSPVYCMGFYPKECWKYDNGNFTADITGKEDLMIAPQISGKWNEQFGSNEANSPKFKHLLTWLKVVLCATTYEAVGTWGEINEITINGLPTEVTANKDGKATFNAGSRNIPLLENPTTLNITNIDIASIMCAPADDYSFSIKTTDGKIARKTMAVPGGFKAGFQYIIVLYFNPLSDIDGVCTLIPWENQNDNLYLQ